MLHNATLNTLRKFNVQLKKEIAAGEDNEDEWSTSSHEQQVLNLKKRWKKFIHLLIGYKRSQDEAAKNKQAVRELKAQLAQLKESEKTPEEKIKEIEATILAMEGGEASE